MELDPNIHQINERLAKLEFGESFIRIVYLELLCLGPLIEYQTSEGVKHKALYTEALDSMIPLWEKYKLVPKFHNEMEPDNKKWLCSLEGE